GGTTEALLCHCRMSRSHTCREADRNSSPRGNQTPPVPNDRKTVADSWRARSSSAPSEVVRSRDKKAARRSAHSAAALGPRPPRWTREPGENGRLGDWSCAPPAPPYRDLKVIDSSA